MVLTAPELTSLTEATNTVVALSDPVLADDASLVELDRVITKLQAKQLAVIATMGEEGSFAEDGSKSMKDYLKRHLGLSGKEAGRRIRLGRSRHRVPRFFEAFSAGTLTAEHLQAVLRVLNPRTEDAFARDEPLLLDQAEKLSFSKFLQVLAYWEQLADPDGTEEEAEEKKQRRSVNLSKTIDDHWLLNGWLDPISGSIVATELERLESLLFEEDWEEASERLGRKPTAGDLTRTTQQRRADALVKMATRSASVPEGSTMPRPLLSVLIDFDTLSGRICELANGTVVTPGSVLPFLDRALVERAVFTPANRVEVSAKQRLFTGATRSAVKLRDRTCTYPGCDVPMDQCQVDHIVPFEDGGETTQANGRLRCKKHNFDRLHGLDDKEAFARNDPSAQRGGTDKDVDWRFSNLEWDWGEDPGGVPRRE